MTLEKAVEELRRIDNRVDIICYPEFRKVVHLGIEALKAVLQARKMQAWADIYSLPGETKEGNETRKHRGPNSLGKAAGKETQRTPGQYQTNPTVYFPPY